MLFFAPASRRASKIAIAAAIMGVSAMGVTAFETPAYAKKDKEEKAANSKEFTDAFLPIQDASQEEGVDKAALLDQILAVESTVSTDADKSVYGGLLYSTARELQNYPLASKGMEMWLESGTLPAEVVPQYNFIAGQLAYNAKNYPLARTRIQTAIDMGYDDPEAGKLIAQTYMMEDDASGGLNYIADQVNNTVKAGGTPDEALLERGFSLAYNNDMPTDAMTFALLRARFYPSEQSWRNAIGVQRNYGSYNDAELLDIMRLLRAANGMKEARDYSDYIDAANFRRLPGEVLVIAEEGVNKGLLSSSDAFVAEALTGSKNAAPGLRSDLAGLGRDARAASAASTLIVSAADAYLNFGDAATAAELYELALTKPGVDRGTALTRLGIAQFQSGDLTAAAETFAKVEGNRAPIAKLWAAYATQQASGGASATAN